MRSADESKRILERVIDLALRDSDDVEVSLCGGRYGITKFSDNLVNKAVDGNFDQLRVRIFVDGKEGRATTSELTDEGFLYAINEAVNIAKYLPASGESKTLPEAQEYVDQDAFDPETERATIVDRMNLVGGTIIRAHAHGLLASGYIATSVGCAATTDEHELDAYAVYNSKGLAAFHSVTNASISVGMVDDRGHGGWAKASSFMLAALNADGITEVAAQKACAPGEIKSLKPGRYRCVIEPAALQQLLKIFGETCGAGAQADNMSILAGNQGSKITSEKITIKDDFSHEQLRATPFDCEGIARKTVSIIENGVVKGPVYGYQSAIQAGVEPTGHTVSCPVRGNREVARHLVMDGGDKGLVEIVSECEQAILISGFGSVKLLDSQNMTLTGTTRDGTFLIRGGQVVCPLKNMSFVINLFDLLNAVEELSTVIACDNIVAPAIRVSELGLVPCQI